MPILSLILVIWSAAAMPPLSNLDLVNAKTENVTYLGKRAVHITEVEKGGGAFATLRESTFTNGTIEADVAGAPIADASATARGFIGIAFRVKGSNDYECFYLRPTNGRADDQLRRNHSVQYISHPEWTWQRLRTETPGVYESYTDLEPGKWMHMKIVVNGKRAELYVNGASQPCLIVPELKKGTTTGAIALWIGNFTDAYFANVKVSKSS